jgi:hypothetical protein
MPDDLQGLPYELASERSVFVEHPRLFGRHHYLYVGHHYEDVGMQSEPVGMQAEQVGEPSELAGEPHSRGDEQCPCGLTLSLFGPLPDERDGLPCVCVGMLYVFGQHPCE